jgi:hypothetical protein
MDVIEVSSQICCAMWVFEKLAAELTGHGVNIAVINETHLKKKNADSCVSIDGYVLFQRDRARRT